MIILMYRRIFFLIFLKFSKLVIQRDVLYYSPYFRQYYEKSLIILRFIIRNIVFQIH